MFPIAGSTPPNHPDELSRALAEGLRAHGLVPQSVQAEGEWPELKRVAVDLTGAEATTATRLPVAQERIGAGPKIAVFEMDAAPLSFEAIPVHLRVRLASAATEFARAAEGTLALTFASAASGEIDLHILRGDLEAGLQAIAAALAAKQGVEVKSTKLEITAPTPRTLDLRVAVIAKVFIMTTTVTVRGRVEIDDQLNARFTGLGADGEGITAGMVESAIRPRLAKLEERTFALGTFVAAGLRVREVAVRADDALRLHATLAGA
jgi:hypothetical protein